MERLRDPETGCPWDVAQTFGTIVSSTLEECYELVAALEQEDYPHVAEELGDVLFQVVFYAQLGREQGLFRFEDIVHTLVDKLLRRHPHVFHDGNVESVVAKTLSVDQVLHSWEKIKQSEREAKSQSGVLADIPLALPALPRAQKLQKRAARVGFDWQSPTPVLAKLQEEIQELQAAMADKSAESIEDEMGDVLFTCVNLARHLGVDAEASLRKSSLKFEFRFGEMESLAAERGLVVDELDTAALDALWDEIKLVSR
jgi:ATP diphosphatase